MIAPQSANHQFSLFFQWMSQRCTSESAAGTPWLSSGPPFPVFVAYRGAPFQEGTSL